MIAWLLMQPTTMQITVLAFFTNVRTHLVMLKPAVDKRNQSWKTWSRCHYIWRLPLLFKRSRSHSPSLWGSFYLCSVKIMLRVTRGLCRADMRSHVVNSKKKSRAVNARALCTTWCKRPWMLKYSQRPVMGMCTGGTCRGERNYTSILRAHENVATHVLLVFPIKCLGSWDWVCTVSNYSIGLVFGTSFDPVSSATS